MASRGVGAECCLPNGRPVKGFGVLIIKGLSIEDGSSTKTDVPLIELPPLTDDEENSEARCASPTLR